jgi:hypothetical protein
MNNDQMDSLTFQFGFRFAHSGGGRNINENEKKTMEWAVSMAKKAGFNFIYSWGSENVYLDELTFQGQPVDEERQIEYLKQLFLCDTVSVRREFFSGDYRNFICPSGLNRTAETGGSFRPEDRGGRYRLYLQELYGYLR